MKVKHYTIMALTAIICLALSGCTQNNGHIGKLFGSWALVAMDVDSEPYEPNCETYLSFQSNVAVFMHDTGNYEYANRVCTWSRHENIISFDFDHHDDKNPAGTDTYAPPEWLLLDDLKIAMTITRLDNGHLDMVYLNDGKSYTYKFERTW